VHHGQLPHGDCAVPCCPHFVNGNELSVNGAAHLIIFLAFCLSSHARSNPKQGQCKSIVMNKLAYNQTDVRCTVPPLDFCLL
jgi:hypothetical protein